MPLTGCGDGGVAAAALAIAVGAAVADTVWDEVLEACSLASKVVRLDCGNGELQDLRFGNIEFRMGGGVNYWNLRLTYVLSASWSRYSCSELQEINARVEVF